MLKVYGMDGVVSSASGLWQRLAAMVVDSIDRYDCAGYSKARIELDRGKQLLPHIMKATISLSQGFTFLLGPCLSSRPAWIYACNIKENYDI